MGVVATKAKVRATLLLLPAKKKRLKMRECHYTNSAPPFALPTSPPTSLSGIAASARLNCNHRLITSPPIQCYHRRILAGRNQKAAPPFTINNSARRVLAYQAIIWALDHYQRHQVDAERIAALLTVSLYIDPMQAHLPDSAICPWKNRFMLAETHLGMRT
jgi:hypothetical protein